MPSRANPHTPTPSVSDSQMRVAVTPISQVGKKQGKPGATRGARRVTRDTLQWVGMACLGYELSDEGREAVSTRSDLQ